jgi:hypothetical protein
MRPALFALTWVRRVGAAILLAWALKYSFYDFVKHNPSKPDAATGKVHEVAWGRGSGRSRVYATTSDVELYHLCLYGSLFLAFAVLK